MNKLLSFLFIGLAIPQFVFSQAYTGQQKPTIQAQQKGANCAPPTHTTFMELNNVRAMIHTAGNLWQRPNQNYSMYEVPKNSGIMALFTAALWLGGTDVNNQLKLAALRYRNGQDYWTGPLSKVFAETTYDNCSKFDKHFVSTQDEIREFNAWYEAGVLIYKMEQQHRVIYFQTIPSPKSLKNGQPTAMFHKGKTTI